MSYAQPYGRPPPPAVPQQPARGYPRGQYPPTHNNGGYYYQNPPPPTQYSNQQYMMPNGNPPYGVVQYGQNGNPQQGPVYLSEEVYAQPMPISVSSVQPPARYPPQAPPTDTRRKKKEYPTAIPSGSIMSPQTLPPSKRQPPVQQQYTIQTQQSPIKQSVLGNSQTDQVVPRITPNIIPTQEFLSPPGCFNIVRRGQLPGLSFSQICVP